MKFRLFKLPIKSFFLGMFLITLGSYAQDKGQKIVGGQDVNIIEHPHQVRLSMGCGGSILSSKWVLTAYHCTNGSTAGDVTVRAGITKLNETGGQLVNVKRIVNIKSFSAGDITLLELETPLDLSGPKVKAIPYISQELFNVLMPLQTVCVGTGWGSTTLGNAGPNNLQTVNMIFTGYKGDEVFLQLGANGIESACHGDSGGPLVLRRSGPSDQILLGVVSHGDSCVPPSYYGNVAKFAKEIEDITGIKPITTTGNPNPNPTGQSAFKSHSIPGIIQAEDFDNGGQGVAYNDNNATNNGGQGRTNEGVDVENTTDAGRGLNVGWIANGEWLEYTIGNVKTGAYDLIFRVAANNDRAKSITAKLGNTNLGSVAVPNTGGWQRWQDVVIKDVNITNGQQILRLDITGGAYNINWIQFKEANVVLPPAGNTSNYVIRARGITGNEKISLKIGGAIVETYTLTTSWANYTASSKATGITQIAYINDKNGSDDVEIDYLQVDANRFQAEEQATNTGLWANGRCGGGSNSQMMHCNGYIQFDLEKGFIAGGGYQQGKVNNKLVVFPNPVIDIVTVKGNEQSKLLEVYDLSGKLMKRAINSQNVDISALTAGPYLLIKDGVVSKVIVKK